MGALVQNIRSKNPFFKSVDVAGQTRRVFNLRGGGRGDVKPATEAVNEYHRQVFKINEQFKTMANKDSARSKFDCMTQGERTVEQYFVELRKQADICQFADRDDSIRTKILHTMNDKQIRREAMLKCLPLDKLLKGAADKEDVERQARDMEKNARDDANRVYEQRKQKRKPARFHAKPPHTPETKPPPSGHAGTQCKYFGYSHGSQRSMCPGSRSTLPFLQKERSFRTRVFSDKHSRKVQ